MSFINILSGTNIPTNTIVMGIYGLAIVMILFGVIVGIIRGFRKSIIYLVAFIILFVLAMILSIPLATVLYSSNLLSNFSSSLPTEFQSANSIKELIPLVAQNIEGYGESIAENEHLILYVEKIALTLLRFISLFLLLTVGKIIFDFVKYILYVILFKGSKEERMSRSKHRLMGGLVGGVRSFITVLLLFVPISFALTIFNGLDIDYSTTAVENAKITRSDVFGLMSNTSNDAAKTVRKFSPDLGTDNEQVEKVVLAINEIANTPLVKVISSIDVPVVNSIFSFTAGEGENESNIKLASDVSDICNIYLMAKDMGLLEEGNFNLSTISENDIDQLINYIKNTDMLTTILPIAADIGLNIMVKEAELELDFDTEALYTIAWKNEIEYIGKASIKAIQATGGTFENIDYNTIDMDLAGEAVTEISKSKAVLWALPTVAEYVVSTDKVSEFASMINVSGMTDEYWKADLLTLVSVVKEYSNLGITDIENIDYEKLDMVSLKNMVGYLFDLNIINTKQDEIVKYALNFVPDMDGVDKNKINVYDITSGLTYDEWIESGKTTEEWASLYKNEALNLVDVLDSAMPLLNMDTEGGIETLDLDAIDEAIQIVNQSLLLNPIIDDVVRSSLNQIDLGVNITIEDGLNWGDEGHNLVIVLKDVQTAVIGDKDITIALLTTDPNKIIASKILSTNIPKLLVEYSSEGGSLDGVLVVPYEADDEIWNDTNSEDGELRKVLVSIQTIILSASSEIDTIDDLSNAISINLITSMSDENIESVLASEIVLRTASKMVTDMSEDIIIPDSAYGDMEKTYISRSEVTNLVKAVSKTDIIQDDGTLINQGLILNTLNQTIVEDNQDVKKLTILLRSTILHATLNNVITNSSDMMVIPNSVYDENGYIEESELEALVNSLDILEIVDENGNISIDASIIVYNSSEELTQTQIDANVREKWNETNGVLSSKIIHSTISKYLSENETLVVPTSVKTDNVINTTELINLFVSINRLDIVDENGNIDVDVSVVIYNPANKQELTQNDIDTYVKDKWNETNGVLSSEIIQSTISKVLCENETLVIPTGVKTTDDEGITLIDNVELINLFVALNRLDIVDDDGNITVNANVIVYSSSDKDTLSELEIDSRITEKWNNTDGILASAIFHSTVSDYLCGCDAITVPLAVKTDEVINSSELINLIIATNRLDIVDTNGNIVNTNAGVINDNNQYSTNSEKNQAIEDRWQIILNSVIIREKISSVLIEEETAGNIAIDIDLKEYYDKTVLADKKLILINKDELVNSIVAINNLDLINANNNIVIPDASIITTLDDDEKMNISLESNIIWRTISNMLQEQNAITFLDDEMQTTRNNITIPKIVKKDVITKLVKSVNELGFVDDSGTIKDASVSQISQLATKTDEQWNTILDSTVIYREISNMITNNGTSIKYPNKAFVDNNLMNLLTKDEIKNVVVAIDKLGIVSGETITAVSSSIFNITSSYQQEDWITILKSSIIHYTISDVLIDEEIRGTITINGTCIVNKIDGTAGTENVKYQEVNNYFIAKLEIFNVNSVINELNLVSSDGSFTKVDFDFLNSKKDKLDCISKSIIIHGSATKAIEDEIATIEDETIRTRIANEADTNKDSNGFIKTDNMKIIIETIASLN